MNVKMVNFRARTAAGTDSALIALGVLSWGQRADVKGWCEGHAGGGRQGRVAAEARGDPCRRHRRTAWEDLGLPVFTERLDVGMRDGAQGRGLRTEVPRSRCH